MEIIKYLVKHGASVNNEALEESISRGFADITLYLIEMGADIYYGNHLALRYSLSCDKYSMFSMLDFLLPRYEINILKNELQNQKTRKKILKYLINRGPSRYPELVIYYRECGIDIYDMIENEM